jgi:hypothetical protein
VEVYFALLAPRILRWLLESTFWRREKLQTPMLDMSFGILTTVYDSFVCQDRRVLGSDAA